MTEIITPVPAPRQLGAAAEPALPATPMASTPAPAPADRSRWRRLASAVADTHRAAVPF